MKIHSKKINLPSRKTILEVFSGISVNLTSGWFGVVLITPGFFGVKDLNHYSSLLIPNMLFGILGLLISFLITEKAKRYD